MGKQVIFLPFRFVSHLALNSKGNPFNPHTIPTVAPDFVSIRKVFEGKQVKVNFWEDVELLLLPFIEESI